jgi:DNA-binding transcriptional LysR family regulator
MDYLTSLAVFVRVADLGSFSAAADELGLSGTMVGKHIRSLEGRLGGTLVARTTRRQSLTELGLRFRERAHAILAQIEEADGLGGELQSRPRGLLRVSAPTGLGVEVLVDAIADFMQDHPQIEVELGIADRVVDIIDEGFHVAIRTGDAVDEGLVARTLAPYAVIACASPAYLASRPPLQHPDDLRRHDRLGFVHWGPKAHWRFVRDAETCLVPVEGRFRADNIVALRRAALAGLGVAVQARVFVAEALAAGALQAVLPEWTLRARPTRIVWPQHMRGSAKLRAFVDFIVRRLG